MTILKKTPHVGCVTTILINSTPEVDLCSSKVDQVAVDYAGFVGDTHYGLTRASCNRVREQYQPGTMIRNARQISIVTSEELQQIAADMLVSELLPEWLGANLNLSGIPDFTLVPPGSRLIFANGVSLVVDMENEPCRLPTAIIDRHFPGEGKKFPAAALHRRGVNAWVEREGSISTGEAVALHIPPQRIYAGC